jgi:hypothetical protein
MYAKIFASMYDGTIVDAGWEAIVTFQQLLILSDSEGVVDMTAEAISRRTTIPAHIIAKGLAVLILPDPHSRSQDCEGRRIELINDARPWGWRIVNYKHYRDMRTAADRREYMRDLMRAKRAAVSSGDSPLAVLAAVSNVSPSYSDASSEADTTRSARKRAEFVLPEWLDEDDWAAFVAHRAALRKPLKGRAPSLVIAKLDSLRAKGHSPRDLINTAIERGWQTVFEPVALGPSKFAPPVGSVKSRERNDPQEGLNPDMSTAAWRRQMAAMGVDVDTIKTK